MLEAPFLRGLGDLFCVSPGILKQAQLKDVTEDEEED
jgi:hypothetical protein